jgi:large subunit ribosomal protein L13
MKTQEPVKYDWHVIDAESDSLGRLATQIASLLLGKHLTGSAKHKVAPVRVIVINADTLVVTGKKRDQKMYRKYSGYPGGLRERTLKEQLIKDSSFVVRQAVSGMLPKNNLRDDRLKNLYIYAGSEHPHMAQVNTPSL